MADTGNIALLRQKYEWLSAVMNEKVQRQWAAAEALTRPRGGLSLVAQATGLSRTTIAVGIRELRADRLRTAPGATPVERVRRPGGGRWGVIQHAPAVLQALEALVEPPTRGAPQSPLRWTCKSTRRLAAELQRQGHALSHQRVAVLLHALGYSLQGNRQTREGASHPARNAQFEHISRTVKAFQRRNQPVLSVDTKKKELVGDFANKGREWQPVGRPEKVRTQDFPDQALGKVIPYGVYDPTANAGWVSVGVDQDTAEFATESIRRWWEELGQARYRQAQELLVTADGGGSNGSRSRLGKVGLQQLADRLGLRISVCQFPPGTRKWNKIEPRLVCPITKNWRGRPLVSRAVVVNLIANTTTEAGLEIQAALDLNSYETGGKVSDEELATVKLKKDQFHGEWNYTISPHRF
jgi:DDE family transposase